MTTSKQLQRMSPCACTLCHRHENSISPPKVCGAFEVTGKNIRHREISENIALVPEPGRLRLINSMTKNIQKAVMSHQKSHPSCCTGGLTPGLKPAQRGQTSTPL